MKQAIQVNVYCPEGVEVLFNIIKVEKGTFKTDVDILFDAVESVTGYTKTKLVGNINSIQVREARWMTYMALKDIIGMGPSEIGKIFNKDHSVVIYGMNRIKALMSVYDEIHETYQYILDRYKDFSTPSNKLNVAI